MRKQWIFCYGLIAVLFFAGIAWILEYGVRLPAGAPLESAAMAIANAGPKGQDPQATLLMQLIVVIGVAKLLGFAFRRLGQPAVVGEMLAGILLGPSLLGLMAPALEGALFPQPSLGALKMLSQVGVVLFMFFVGLELDLGALKQRATAAVLVSHASIAAPFLLGAALALVLFQPLAGAGVSFTAFALFLATAMSITAFPVLARIIEERGLARTQLGGIAIACAAVDDVTAWCILALVVAIARAQALAGAALTLALAAAFIAVMVLLIRPRMARLERLDLSNETRNSGLIIVVLLLVFASALITESIGIHALFGAFLAGAIMPSRAPLSGLLKTRLETFGNLFLVPLFFAFTGLRTQIGLLDGDGWGFCAAIIGVAVLGKFGGTLLAARSAGLGWHMSASLGALMNTRGLMELIVLNIGYDLGILSPKIFAMMVLMALVTTLMTGPLLDLFDYLKRRYPAATPVSMG